MVAEAQGGCNSPVQTTAQCFAALVEEEGAASDAVNAGAESAAALIDTVFHRVSLMYQGVTNMGVSVGMYTFSDMGFISHAVDQNNLPISTQVNAGNYFAVYPTDGQRGIGTISMSESPTPYPANVTTPAYPISVASENSTTLNVTTFTVTQAGSTTPLASLLLAGGTAVPNNLAFLIATTPFLPNTIYTVNFVGTITGTATGSATGIPMNKSWSFTTGAANCGPGYDVLC